MYLVIEQCFSCSGMCLTNVSLGTLKNSNKRISCRQNASLAFEHWRSVLCYNKVIAMWTENKVLQAREDLAIALVGQHFIELVKAKVTRMDMYQDP